MKFLKDNWIWIVAPVVIFAIAVAAVVLLGSEPTAQGEYTLR